MSDTRIIDQTTDTSLVDGDYVIVDSQNEGTRKYNLGKEIRDIKTDLLQVYVSGTSLIINGGIPDGEGRSY